MAMTASSTPNFAAPALELWGLIPVDERERLLASVWCRDCRREGIITNFTGVIRDGNLLLVGECAECYGDS